MPSSRSWPKELGDVDHAITYLNKGVDLQSGGAAFVSWLRDQLPLPFGDLRFARYLDRVHLTPYFKLPGRWHKRSRLPRSC